MSNALRCAKYSTRRMSCAGQPVLTFWHFHLCNRFSFAVELHAFPVQFSGRRTPGHLPPTNWNRSNSFAPRRTLGLQHSSTSGITMPALRMTTVSPMRMSLRQISSSLCNVAREIGRALHEDRFKFCHWRQHTRAPDLHSDVAQNGLGRSDPRNRLVDDGVAGRARLARNPFAVIEAIHLQHKTVNVVGQLLPQVALLVVIRDDFLSR